MTEIIGTLPPGPVGELLRLVTLSPGGKPQLVLDLASGATYLRERGTFGIEPGERETQEVARGGRYGGSVAVAERVGNARAVGSWFVTGETAEIAVSNLRSLLAELETPAPGRYLEWRPDGALHSTLLERRGAATWKPTYRSAWWRGAKMISFEVSLPVAPTGLGLPLDVFDDFSDLDDWTFVEGEGTIAAAGGVLVPSDAVLKRLLFTGRGYRHSDVEATLKLLTGASVTGSKNGPILRSLGDEDYLRGTLREGSVAIVKTDAGADTTLVAAAFTPAASTAYWVRFRTEGDVLTVEVFDSEPSVLSTPDASDSYTLTGADAAKFGADVEGDMGISLNPAGTDWRYEEARFEPYTYKGVTAPAVISLGGRVPGDTDALVDVAIAHSGGADPPLWALLGWAARPGLGQAPFGILEAEDASALTGWAVTANVNAHGGDWLADVAVAGFTTYSAEWTVDPSLLVDPDEFTPDEIAVEVYARAFLDTDLVTPRLAVSTRPAAGAEFGSPDYSAEFGETGRLLVVPSAGAVWRPTRLGTLTFTVDPDRPRTQILRVDGQVGPGSSGAFGFDYLVLVLARARILGPTGKPGDATYPAFLHGTSAATKEVLRDGQGRLLAPGGGPHADHGLGGSLPRLRPGLNDVLVKLSSLVPDDPTSDAGTEQLSHAVAAHFRVQPRFPLLRD